MIGFQIGLWAGFIVSVWGFSYVGHQLPEGWMSEWYGFATFMSMFAGCALAVVLGGVSGERIQLFIENRKSSQESSGS